MFFVAAATLALSPGARVSDIRLHYHQHGCLKSMDHVRYHYHIFSATHTSYTPIIFTSTYQVGPNSRGQNWAHLLGSQLSVMIQSNLDYIIQTLEPSKKYRPKYKVGHKFDITVDFNAATVCYSHDTTSIQESCIKNKGVILSIKNELLVKSMTYIKKV